MAKISEYWCYNCTKDRQCDACAFAEAECRRQAAQRARNSRPWDDAVMTYLSGIIVSNTQMSDMLDELVPAVQELELALTEARTMSRLLVDALEEKTNGEHELLKMYDEYVKNMKW